jgi:predicted acylesterase/phospholipase RssA
MAARLFKVHQSSTWRDGLWDWSLWLVPAVADTSMLAVKWVSYGLHPCFPNPNRVIRNHQQLFRLNMLASIPEEATWGRFEVRVTIALQNGVREIHSAPLDLRTPDGAEAPELLPVENGKSFDHYRRIYELLKRKSAFGFAREVLHKAQMTSGDEVERLGNVWLAQQTALCTYKDASLPADTRLQTALDILKAVPCNLESRECRDPETLGLGGAICKRLWDLDRSLRTLERALYYYSRSYEVMLDRRSESDYDGGAFAGSNVSYLHELLAAESDAHADANHREVHIDAANAIRKQLIVNLTGMQAAAQTNNRPVPWWIAATLLESYVGLAIHDPQYEAGAREQARIVRTQAPPSAWELQSTGMQLLRARALQRRLVPERAEHTVEFFRSVVQLAFGDTFEELRHDGKFGLALSGGGFRASLFHIGVLARMAELDVLRHVEVISCVSGGSIVGAHYYLLLRQLLQSKADEAIRREDYVELVRQLLDQFLAGVQKNIRMNVAASLQANLLMIFNPSTYSRTQRLGELYEKYLYSQITDGEGDEPRWLNEAFIIPRRADGSWCDGFSPKLDNWRRSNKVPNLVLNATSLNTGRNWQFTASWMGEPLSYGTGVDATERLQPVYFSEAPVHLHRYRFGHAVAASSCVPGLFTPIVINDLYPDRTVRLVDGGVHDNQGTRALLDQDCDSVVVSDASGQMDAQRNPVHSELGVVSRTNSVLQARVRVAQHQELQARDRFGLLRGCTFLHLRKRIESAPVAALGAVAATQETRVGVAALDSESACTEYGINKELQRCLSKVRTDLDSFTDREALTLMYSGYAMALKYFETTLGNRRELWRFLDVGAAASSADAGQLKILLAHIRVAARLPLKVWFLHPVLKVLGTLLLVGAGAGVIAVLWGLSNDPNLRAVPLDLSSAAQWALNAALVTAVALVAPWAKRWVKSSKQASHPASIMWKVALGIAMALFGSLVCKLHLWTFDKLFIRLGRVPAARGPTRNVTPANALRMEG